MRLISAIAIFFVSLLASAQTVTNPSQLIAAMHDRYADKWYRTLTFEQQSITHKPDGSDSTELWHEALLLPGRLRIDVGDPSAGKGMLFVNNHLYIFRDGKLVNERDYIHPLLVMGFDVYTQPAGTTLQQLKDLHLDLATMHDDTLDGRAVYVIGAKPGDLQSFQFWIDKERLYFVRMLRPNDQKPGEIEDVRFEDYKPTEGGGWLSEHVVMINDGKVVFEERYSDIKINPPLSEALFDPASFVQKAASPGR